MEFMVEHPILVNVVLLVSVGVLCFVAFRIGQSCPPLWQGRVVLDTNNGYVLPERSAEYGGDEFFTVSTKTSIRGILLVGAERPSLPFFYSCGLRIHAVRNTFSSEYGEGIIIDFAVVPKEEWNTEPTFELSYERSGYPSVPTRKFWFTLV